MHENWQMVIRKKYGNGENFLKLFNPDKQTEYYKHLEKCFMGDVPSLSRLSVSFGTSIAEVWLEIQINDLAAFTGVKKSSEDAEYLKQVETLAKTIICAFSYLKVTELMVFFQKFKAGEYGKFYGVFDNLVITEALTKFLEYRKQQIDIALREKENKRREQSAKEAVTYEEYLAIKKNKLEKEA